MNHSLEIPVTLSENCIQQATVIPLMEEIICYKADIKILSNIFKHYRLEQPSYLKNANSKRLNEFFSGRIIAEAILKKHFNCSAKITSMQFKLPKWPINVIGSISHSNHWIIVAISSQTECLGIDLEHIVDITFVQESALLILTQSEQTLWQREKTMFISFREYLTLIFSLKESLYKAVYPITQSYIDFLEVAVVRIDIKKQIAIFKFDEKIQKNHGLYTEYQGFWNFKDDYVVTWVTVKI